MDSRREKIEATYSRMLNISSGKSIADGKRVGWSDLVIDSWTDPNPALRNAEHLRERIDNAERSRIQNCPINDGAIVDSSQINNDKERRELTKWPLHAAAILFQLEWCLLSCIRVA